MKWSQLALSALVVAFALWTVKPASMAYANPSAAQALRLAPTQKGVDYSQPSAEEADRCTIESKKLGENVSAWVVYDPNGLVLRMFVDTRGDNTVDQWRYFKDGIEVYRDIDSTSNQKPDQFRWLHTGGSRWGVDETQDSVLDVWKQISAEEVTAEVVAALAEGDATRFKRLVLTEDELKSLGLGAERAKQLAQKLEDIHTRFQKALAEQRTVTEKTKWLQFSSTRPGVVPAGTEGATKDVEVYENVVALVETEGEHGQVHIGTLVRVGPVWRVIDVPEIVTDSTSAVAGRGFFYQPAGGQREIASGGSS